MLFLFALLLAQDDLVRDIDALGSERVEEREAATRRLKAKGVDILPALRAKAEHPDPEVATRVRALLRLFEIRASFSPRLTERLPGLDERLATGPPAEWTKALLAAAELDTADLEPLAAAAVRGASTEAEIKAVCAAVEKRRLRSAFPALVEWIRARNKIPASMASALAALRDPAAVPILLDFPILPDGCLVYTAESYLRPFGTAAHPELRRRLVAWKAALDSRRTTGVWTALTLIGDAELKEVDPSLLDFYRHLSAATTTEHDYLLGHVAAALYPRHQAEVVGSLDAALKRPRRLGILLHSLEKRAKEDVARLWADIWARTRERKDVEPETRQEILDGLWRLAPETLWLDSKPPRDTPEALAVIQSLRYHDKAAEERRASGLARVMTYLKAASSPAVSLSLAYYHNERREDRLAEPRFAEARALLHDEPSRAYAEALLRLGRVEEAEAHFHLILRQLKEAGVDSPEVQARLDFAASLPRDPRVRWRAGPSPKTKTHSYMEVADGRVFFLGVEDALCLCDPFSGEITVIAPRPGKVRDFMPLDGRRVFVALDDGTAHLYEAGKAAPLWSRPLSLGDHSALTASPRCVTAAAEDGTFHAIHPADGKTLWTRRVEARPWRALFWRSDRGATAQGVDRVIVPVARDRLELVDLASGETRGEIRPGFAVARIVEAGDVLLLAGRNGHYAGFARQDGTSLWRGTLGDDVRNSDIEMDLSTTSDGTRAYLALHGRILALDPRTGRASWEWRWASRPGGEPANARDGQPWPRVLPTSGGLFCVVTWDAKVSRYSARSDVIFLTPEGKADLQYTCPRDGPYSDFTAKWPVAFGGNLAVYRNGWEIWERPNAAGAPADRR